MIAQWENVSHCLISRRGGVFQGIFPWPITLCQPNQSQCGRKCLDLLSTAPHNIEEKIRSLTIDRQ